jgi:hypothetical protein
MSPFQGLINTRFSVPVALPQAILFRPFGAFQTKLLSAWSSNAVDEQAFAAIVQIFQRSTQNGF